MNDKVIYEYKSLVSREKRENLHRHRAFVLWFTGLSGSGKSTLAHALEEQLHQMSYSTFVLDGDNVRHGLCADLGFAESDRNENVRRIVEVSKLLINAGVVTITALISPLEKQRKVARDQLAKQSGDFVEIYCKCSLDVCEQRDVKGLYKKARAEKMKNFTGLSSPYEPPRAPELAIETDMLTVDKSVKLIMSFLKGKGMI
jgi:adenylylsulfate kinase